MQEKNLSERNIGIDFAKYFCSFLVICIHSPYLGQPYIEPFARLAVPIFFMITGFFYSSTRKKNKEISQITKILKLSISAHLLYLIWDVAFHLVKNGSFADYLRTFSNSQIWLEFLFLNNSPISEHLWYLNSLIYVLIVVYFFEKKYDRKYLYKTIPVLIFFNIILGTYSTLLFNTNLSIVYSRNFLFCGLPFFLLGDYFNTKIRPVQNRKLIIIVLLSILGTAIEKWFLKKNGLITADCFLSTPFLAASLFLLIIQNEPLLKMSWIGKIALIGRRTSTMIYIVHPIMISVVGKVIRTIGSYIAFIPKIYQYFSPVIILFITTAFCCFFLNVTKKVRGK